MKHQASIRALALFTCGCLVCADALEAAVPILPISSMVTTQSTSPKRGAAPKTNATKSSSSRSRAQSSGAKKSASSPGTKAFPQRAATRPRATAQSAKKRTVPTKNTVNKSSAKRAVARKAAAKRFTKSTNGAATMRTSSAKKSSGSARFSTASKKRYSSRYRSSAKSSSKKYARSSSRRHSRKYYSTHRRSKSSSRYATSQPRAVSETVLKAQTSFAETWHETLQDEELMPGVRYKHYIISTGSKHSIHVLEVDRTKPDVGIALWKAQNLANGLESLPAIANRADSGKTGALQGMVNANFWRSYYNTPLGPAVVNGEVLEMGQYKGWSSCFFDRQNRMYIERFSITATLRTRETSFPLETVNARLNPNGVVLYNHYAGKEVPLPPVLPVGNVEQGTSSKTKAGENSFPIDDKLTQSQIQKTLEMQRRIYAAERPLYKATLLYASAPVINEEIVCRVVEIDTGAVAVPQNGVVVSFGKNIDESELPHPGDKVTLMFKTNTYSSVPFVHAVSGTPRLVRSGIARHEAGEESTSGRNFITQKLPRTAIGTNSAGTMLYFVTTDATDTEAGTTGMTLQELAEGMKQIGAYHAVNLDGGASASMVVRGSVNSAIGSARPVSMALGIVQQDPTADRLQPKRKLITKPIGKQPSKSEQRPGGTPRQDASNSSETEQSLLMREHKPEEHKPEERK